MIIDVRNIDSRQLIRTITSEELLKLCDNDERMFDDYVRLLRNHPKRRAIDEIWQIVD